MKKLVLNRRDLVWENYETVWDAEDWDRYVKWLAGVVKHQEENNSRATFYRDLYNLVKDLTWDDVIADFNEFEENYESNKCLYIERHNHQVNQNGSQEDWSYKNFLHDIIREAMQEELYNDGPYDTEYADDYEEDFSVEVDISEGKKYGR